MIKTLKVIAIGASFSVALTTSVTNGTNDSEEQLQHDKLYACHWWPTCRDPDQQKPAPTDSSAPKPSGDKDTTKDKKDDAQLA
jgi:hypothetical protein